jgi:HipA-like protein
MKQAQVYYKNELAARLTLTDQREYVFRYEDDYFRDSSKHGISLTLPKTTQEYRSKTLFPFFFNMLAEGVNKRLQSRQLQLDENDNFSLLLSTAGSDTIGAVTVKPIQS